MKTAKYFIIPMLFLAACQPVEQDLPEKEKSGETVEVADSVWSVTLLAAKGDAETKALDLTDDGYRLNTYWRASEQVKVYKDVDMIGTLAVAPEEGEKPTKATLSGAITVNGLNDGDILTLVIPRTDWDYSQQYGTLETIQDLYDYALATVTVSTVDIENQTISTTNAHFVNQQSIYRFAFLNGSTPLGIKEYTVRSINCQALVTERSLGATGWTSTTGTLSVKPATATTEPLFVSIRNEMPAPSAAEIEARTVVDTYGFVITGSDDALYFATKGIPAHVLDVPGKFISSTTIVATQPDFSPASGEISNPGDIL
jgi:hypothetical protein